MDYKKALLVSAALGFALTGCGSTNGTNAPAPDQVANLTNNVLQLAVGSANIAGQAGVGLNVVATYRQPTGGTNPGASATLLNEPTLTVAGTLPATAGAAGATFANASDPDTTILSGPSAGDKGGSVMHSSSQDPGAGAVTTFGLSGMVSGLGIEPFNALGPAEVPYSPSSLPIGSPFNWGPYQVPLFDPNLGADPNAFVPWGGPPAFDVLGNGQSPVGTGKTPVSGQELGLDVFAGVTPAAGPYSLSVAVPANTGAVTQSANFTLAAAPPTVGLATNPTFTPDGNGGGTLSAVALPANATEAYVEVTDYGPTSGTSCNGASAGGPVYYTFAVPSGSLTLGDTAGPGGTPSVCTAAQNTTANGAATSGDQITVQVIAADYPMYEMTYPKSNGNPSPTLAGANGSADISVNAQTCTYDAGGGAMAACPANPNPLARKH